MRIQSLVIVGFLSLSAVVARPLAQSEEARRVSDAAAVLGEVMAAEDKAIPKAILAKAEAIAVFPSLKKGGLGIGGQIGFAQMVWPVYFGRTHLGSITGLTRPATSLIMGTGSGMMAFSADSTGSYALGLWAITASWFLAAIGMLLCKPLKKKP